MCSRRRLRVLIALGTLAGCGPSDGLDLARVRGSVNRAGGAGFRGTILFVPDGSKGTVGPPSMGSIGTDGTFVLSTGRSGDGAIVGFHKVGIKAFDADTPTSKAAPRKAAPASVRGRASPRPLIPPHLAVPDRSGIAVEVKGGSNTLNFLIRDDGSVSVEP